MKRYGFYLLLFFFVWIIISHLFTEQSWWSIFSSNRSTHTPLTEQISLIKVTFATLIFLGLAYLLNRILQKRN